MGGGNIDGGGGDSAGGKFATGGGEAAKIASETVCGTPSMTPNPKNPMDAMPATKSTPVNIVPNIEYSSPFDHSNGSDANTDPVAALFFASPSFVSGS